MERKHHLFHMKISKLKSEDYEEKFNFPEVATDRIFMLQFKKSIHFFLSPKGRIKRAPFLLGEFLIVFSWFVLVNEDKMSDSATYLNFLIVVFVLAIVWIHWVLTIKRLHDVNLSGWFSVINSVPIINLLFILFLSFKGSVEPNKYGENISAEKQKN